MAIKNIKTGNETMIDLLSKGEEKEYNCLKELSKLSTGVKLIKQASKDLQEEFHDPKEYIARLQLQVDEVSPPKMNPGLLNKTFAETLKVKINGSLIIDPSKYLARNEGKRSTPSEVYFYIDT